MIYTRDFLLILLDENVDLFENTPILAYLYFAFVLFGIAFVVFIAGSDTEKFEPYKIWLQRHCNVGLLYYGKKTNVSGLIIGLPIKFYLPIRGVHMNSFALWFSPVDDQCTDASKADVHFNLWNLHYKQAIPPNLDVGVKILNIKQCKEVHFFVPFDIEKDNISDLGENLKASEMLCSVFNEDYTSAHKGGYKIVNVTNNDKKPIMNIYCLDMENDIHLVKKYGGTIISFDCTKELRKLELPGYFRFRIQSKEFKKIIKCYNSNSLFQQSAVFTTEALDFRFNDYRSLPPTLIEEMYKKSRYQFGKVHFLLLTEADVDIQYSSTDLTARELENGVWKKYFNKLNKKNIVAYHWKFTSECDNKFIKNCIMFVKIKVPKYNGKTISLYIVTLGILTIFFNFISGLLFGRL